MVPEQMAPMDLAYLAMDTSTTNGNVCVLMPLAGPVTLEAVRAQVAGGLAGLPSLRHRLHSVAMGLDRPWWVEDTDFDVTRHVRQTSVPAATDTAIAETVARIAGEHLDRNHPLWEVHLLQLPAAGATAAGSAILTKVHHALADGWSYRRFLNALFGPDVQAAPLVDPAWSPQPPPSDVELLGRSAVETARWLSDTVTSTMRQVAEEVRAWPDTSFGLPAYHVAPDTRFNRSVSAARSWAGVSVDLAPSEGVRRRHGAKVNDILLASIGASLRDYLVRRGELPRTPLVALVPMSQRHLTEDTSGANRIAIGCCVVPTHLDDAAQRLQAAHESMTAAKDRPMMDEAALDASNRFSSSVTTAAAELTVSLRLNDYVPATYNMLVSNVPMGDDLLRVAGADVEHQYPVPPMFDGMGLNVTTHGYRGRLDIGVITCPDLAPDAREICEGIVAGYEEICRLAD